MKRHLLFAAMLMAVVAVAAQNDKTYAVSGSLADASGGAVLPYVNCVLLHSGDSSFAYGTTSGEKGVFQFRQVAAGSYLLRVSYIGYQTHWQSVEVRGDQDLGKVELRKSPTVLNAVTVTASKPLYTADGEKQLYNVTEDASVQGGTMSDVLQNAPGVEVDAEGNITLRGTTSVDIWINDRPSHMNAEALKQYIKQMPAGAIERVEVITNPSARYSSGGAVINIVTNQHVKRNQLLCVGLNANSMPSYSPWVSYVWANEKFDVNFYLNASYSKYRINNKGTSTLLNDTGAVSRTQDYSTTSRNNGSGGYAGLNFNWNIDSMTSLSGWMGAYPHWSNSVIEGRYGYIEYLPALRDLSYTYAYDDNSSGGGGYGGLWFEHRFDTTGRKVSLSVNGNTWRTPFQETESMWDFVDPSLADLSRREGSSSSSPSLGAELNYTHPFRNGIEAEAGLEYSLNYSRERFTFDTLAAGGDYSPVLMRYNNGHGRDNGLSGYLTAQRRWGGLTVKVGLRAEESWLYSRFAHEATPGVESVVDTAFFGLVPSVHLSYTTKTFSNYTLSYTRRYSQPEASQLTTFVEYDDYSYITGNPLLRFSYAHNLEAAWSRYVPKFGNISLSAYFHANTDEIGELTDVAYSSYHGAWVNCSYPVNIGNSHTEGLQANLTYRPTAMFNIRLNASVFNYHYNTVYRGAEVSDGKVSCSVRLNVWAKVWKKLEIFANAHYSSARLGFYSLSNPNKGLDFGCSADFYDRRLTVRFNVNDIFGWSEWGSNSTNPYYTTTGRTTFSSRFVGLGLTFRFGKMELESKARQGSSSQTGVPAQ